MGGGIGFSPDPLLAFPSPVLSYTYYWCCNKGKRVLQATVNFSCNLRQSRPRTTAPHIPRLFSQLLPPKSFVIRTPRRTSDLWILKDLRALRVSSKPFIISTYAPPPEVRETTTYNPFRIRTYKKVGGGAKRPGHEVAAKEQSGYAGFAGGASRGEERSRQGYVCVSGKRVPQSDG